MVSTTDEVMTPVEAQETTVEIKAVNEDDFEKAQKIFQSGKKNLFLNKYDESVNNIGEACKVYSSKFGEFDPQCAEVYFFYGKALLELARVETTVLGNALNGVPEDNSPIDDSRYGNPEDIAEEEKKDITEQVIHALCDTPDVEKPATTETTTTETDKVETTTEATTKPVEEETKVEETKVEVTPAEVTPTEVTPVEATTEVATTDATPVEATTAEEEAEGEDDGEDEGEEVDEEAGEDLTKNDEQVKDEAEAEEISNLQRSWEMFELAKLVYTKNFDNDVTFKNKRIAECLLKLGEISIEQEIYEQAIVDITESIRLQEEQKEERDERMLAESFYQLALAQQFNNQFKEANETYQKSINIMQLRIEKLKGKLVTIKDEVDAEAERNTINDEIAELEALLPEMMSKLEEVNEQGQQSLTIIKEVKDIFVNTIAPETKSNGISNGEVKDITNMVKSKRKIDATSDDLSNVKKTRLSENGEVPNGNTVETENAEMTERVEETKPEELATADVENKIETEQPITV